MPRLDEARLAEIERQYIHYAHESLTGTLRDSEYEVRLIGKEVLELIAALRVERERAERLERELDEAAKWIALQDAPDAGIVVAEIEARLRALSEASTQEDEK